MKAFRTKEKREVDKIDSEIYLSNLIDQYQNLIFSICYKITQDYFAAEDLTQETFLSAYTHRESFDGRNEKSWIARIATNKSIDYVNQAGRRVLPTEDSNMEEYRSLQGLPEKEVMQQDMYEQLKKNCESLKPPYDKVAYLYFHQEKTPQEIAGVLGKNVKTIQTQIYRARTALQKIYKKERSR